MRHRILLHTNPTHIKTGLAENARTLLKYLYQTGKYDIAHYCSQAPVGDGNLRFTPWKSFGSIPNDQRLWNEICQDPGKARNVAYGSWNIDAVVKEWKPTIYIGSDDIWSFPKGDYMDKPWWKQINSILHITVDSLPILEQAYEQASLTKHYLTWAKFAAKEMHRFGDQFKHVDQIYGAMDTTKFAPIDPNERAALRRRFGIADSTVVFLFVGRNQLRKQFVQTIEAFANFRRDNPHADAKLWFHTSFSEKANGWDIPKMAGYHGLTVNDILCTYVCRTCGEWSVRPYGGEDLDCPACKAQKSLITASIVHGVPDDQMRFLYGISDACISAFSSGGQEYHSVQSLLCGKPLACTTYSCGEDFADQPGVFNLGYTTYIEQGNNFIKSTTSIKDLKAFMGKVWRTSPRELAAWGAKGREWAVKTFSIETIGAQWEKLFDAMPAVDWSKVSFTQDPKNEQYPFPRIEDEDAFITALYTNILKMDEPVHGEGHKSWKARLKEGAKREDIYNYFIGVARQENGKNQPAADFWSLVDKTGRKRGLVVVKESIGDIMLVTSLFRSFHEQHPDTDLYVAIDPKYTEVLGCNPHIHRILPYQPAFEQELLMMGAGQREAYFDHYYHVCIQTQRLLSYLSQPKPAFDLTHA